ncbi:hypothetical protein [Kitasatospora sp. NPDC056181]|uniref:NucA/NucB deoxyribonuclease domain-containing protein n=1 Tax=Kitasatospora sp. NPDC056181 TaxID=3345737 RepID=UPI0035D661B7
MTTSMTLNATSTTWNELVTVGLESATGDVTRLDVGFDVSCDSQCTATTPTPWAGQRSLGIGQQASGSVTYSESLPAGSLDSKIKTAYHMFVTMAGAQPTQPNADWSNSRLIRCDNAVGQYPGCVYPDVRANLVLPLSQYGAAAAAATYAWAIQNMTEHWGATDNPLQRMQGEDLAKANRRRTCEDGTFNRLAAVTNDSCDEYPFAGTYQGGHTGCADIVPQLENGQWKFYTVQGRPDVTRYEPCVRSHVPLTENSAAGGKYGSFVQTDRVLDSEKFVVSVTS